MENDTNQTPNTLSQTPPTQEKKTGSNRAVYAGGILFAAALIGLGVVPRLRQHNALTESVAEARSESKAPLVEYVALDALPPPPIEKSAKKPADNPNDLLLPASMEAIQETTISARTTGYLRHRYVDIGSRVASGQLLAEIESPEVDQQKAQAQAQTAKSEAGTGQAQADVARLQAGTAQSQADSLKSQAALQQSHSARSRAIAKLASARAAVANARARQAQSEQLLEGKKSDLTQVRTQLDLDEKTLTRWQSLGKEGAVAQQDIDTREAAYKTRLASVSSAQSAIASAAAEVDSAKQAVAASLADAQAAQADVTASNFDIRAAEAQVSYSKANIAASQASVQSSRATVRAAQAQVGADNANVARYEVLQSFEKVTAPFSGIITRRDVDNGTLITAGGASGASLFGLARTDTLRILVNVPQSAVASIHPRQKVDVIVREYAGRKFTGVVFNTGGSLTPETRTLLTEIHVDNPKNALLPGMYAQVRFAKFGESGKHLPHIPANTLISDADGTRVASITAQGTVHFVPIVIGRDFGTELEAAEGLTGTEHLIVNPSDDLKEGQKVQATLAAPPPDPNAKK